MKTSILILFPCTTLSASRITRVEATVFKIFNNGIAGSNPTRDTDVCTHFFSVFVSSCVGTRPAVCRFSVQTMVPDI